MRKILAIISRFLVALLALMTVIYNVYLFIEKVKAPDKTFFDVLALVLLVLYSAAALRVGFEMFINAGSLAYSVGRDKRSRVFLRFFATVTGYYFIIPHAVALASNIFNGTAANIGTAVYYVLIGDLVVYYIFRWLTFLTDVSEGQ